MEENRNYYTKENTNITKRIKDGKTEFIEGTNVETEIKTYNKAKKQGSYYYDVYSNCEKTNKRVQIGFAIPK